MFTIIFEACYLLELGLNVNAEIQSLNGIYPLLFYLKTVKIATKEDSCAIPISFKSVVIFADFVLISVKMITLLKEMRIAQLSS